MMPNVCYVVAAKDEEGGTYTPENEVFEEIEDAIQHACGLLDEYPTCDPKVVQVILDPMHPSLVYRRVVEDLSERIRDEVADAKEAGTYTADRDSDYIKGLKDAIDALVEEGAVTEVDDLEEGGNGGN